MPWNVVSASSGRPTSNSDSNVLTSAIRSNRRMIASKIQVSGALRVGQV
jgi:hypothetical protein